MSALWRLLSAIGAGVAHFAFTLRLGSSIHCAETRGCADTDWIQPPDGDIFALPLSLVRETLLPFFEGHSFSYYSAFNSAAFGLVILAALGIYSIIRARLQLFIRGEKVVPPLQ